MKKLSFFEKRFLQEYLSFENWKNGTAVYRKLRPHTTYGSAKVGASRVVNRIRVIEGLNRRLDKIREEKC